MERTALEAIRAAGVQAPRPDLSSLTTWRCQDSPHTSETCDEVLGGEMPRGPKGIAGQSGQEDGRRGRRETNHSSTTPHSCTISANFRKSTTSAPSLDSQTRLQRTASVRQP